MCVCNMLLLFITDHSLAAETVQPTRLSPSIVQARYSKTISLGIPLISNHRTSVHPLRGELSKVSLNGSWYWRANCAVGSYRGSARIFQQTSDRFSGRLGNTSFYDRGSISDGLLRGRVASFTLSAFGESARIRAVVVGTEAGQIGGENSTCKSAARIMPAAVHKRLNDPENLLRLGSDANSRFRELRGASSTRMALPRSLPAEPQSVAKLHR